jgi:hypothetical protein
MINGLPRKFASPTGLPSSDFKSKAIAAVPTAGAVLWPLLCSCCDQLCDGARVKARVKMVVHQIGSAKRETLRQGIAIV